MAEGFGKIFSKAFTGSMYGAGANVFAVWFYAIANAKPPDGEVELNPDHVGPMIGISPGEVCDAIDYLLAEDLYSRTEDEGGRRLVGMSEMYRFRIVTFHKYRALGGNQSEYQRLNRERQRRFREKNSGGGGGVTENVTLVTLPNVTPASASASASVLQGNGDVGEGGPNHPPLSTCVTYFQDHGGYSEPEVKTAFLGFQANRREDGTWMWGERPVGDWRASMESRMLGKRKTTKEPKKIPEQYGTAAQAVVLGEIQRAELAEEEKKQELHRLEMRRKANP